MADELVMVAADLYRFVVTAEVLDREPASAPPLERLRAWAAELAERLNALRQRAAHGIPEATGQAAENLRAMVGELTRSHPRVTELRERWRALGYDYEAILAYIQKRRLPVPHEVRLGHVKPRNYARNLFHVLNGIIGALIYELFPERTTVLLVSGSVLALFIGMELTRRFSTRANEWFVRRLFGRISRPNEAHRIPGSTWYVLALVIGVAVFPQRAIQIGALVLAFGDPAASLAGKRWGTRKLLGEKSVAGTLTFTLVAAAVVAGFLAYALPGLGLGRLALVAAGVAVAGAVAELLGGRVDDNFTIPLAAAGAATILLG